MGVSATLAVEDAAVLAEMPLQIRQPHAPANSIVSRKACGESSFSASSRWHSRTSFKVSRRFAWLLRQFSLVKSFPPAGGNFLV